MNTIILQHMALANKLAYDFKKKVSARISFDELQSAAYLALVEAASRYDSSRGVAFSTFVYFRIIGALKDYLTEVNHKFISNYDYLPEVPEDVSNVDELIDYLVEDLPSDAKDIFTFYYVENRTMKEIGEYYQVSESRISQKISEYKKDIQSNFAA